MTTGAEGGDASIALAPPTCGSLDTFIHTHAQKHFGSVSSLRRDARKTTNRGVSCYVLHGKTPEVAGQTKTASCGRRRLTEDRGVTVRGQKAPETHVHQHLEAAPVEDRRVGEAAQPPLHGVGQLHFVGRLTRDTRSRDRSADVRRRRTDDAFRLRNDEKSTLRRDSPHLNHHHSRLLLRREEKSNQLGISGGGTLIFTDK